MTMISGAVISDDGLYRYRLYRKWRDNSDSGQILWVMLNPSTADATQDDPTIRRCVGFSKLWGYEALEVVNLYALRATDPAQLERVADPVGPDNDRVIEERSRMASLTVVAWGAHRMAQERARQVYRLPLHNAHCLGVTKDGSPRHPLYVSSTTSLVRWNPRW